jgi:hypothetical protein
VLEERSKSKKQRFRVCVDVRGNLRISWWHLPPLLAIVRVETALDKGRETSSYKKGGSHFSEGISSNPSWN